MALALALPAAAQAPPGLDAARATVEKWVETRRAIAREKRDWATGRELLQQRAEVVRREITALRGKIAEAEGRLSEVERKQASLESQRDGLQAVTAGLEGLLARVEQGVRLLLARLPEPMRERLRPLSQRLPRDGGAAGLSLGDRCQTAIGILNELARLDGQVTVGTEIRALPDGSSAEVTALYLGVAQGYYVGPRDDVAGVGAPGPDGWTWTPAADAAPAIRLAIAVFRSEQVAQFVRLPVRVQ